METIMKKNAQFQLSYLYKIIFKDIIIFKKKCGLVLICIKGNMHTHTKKIALVLSC